MGNETVIGGRYLLKGRVGQGGMATVYSGMDALTNEIVAIKHLKAEAVSLDPDLVERFEREGDALRRLNHPNIVKVLATVNEGDEHYVVMEYVAGGDLRGVLDEHRRSESMIPLKRIMNIALDLTDALTRAHRLQIIHRDIKPANVLMAEDGTPRLSDFGVAHFGDSTRMTQTGSIIGTLTYISPEACMGHDLDARADIWSFGVMFYEMLTLELPFDESNTAALMYAIMAKQYTPVLELRPDCPPALAALIDQMLVKDPEARINSVRLVGAQVEAIIEGRDVPSSTNITSTSPSLPEGTPQQTAIIGQDDAGERPTDQMASPAQWPNVPADTDTGEFLPGEKGRTRDKAKLDSDPLTRRADLTNGARNLDHEARSNRTPLLIGGAVLLTLILAVAAFVLLPNLGDAGLGVLGGSNAEPIIVAPVAEDEFMVLVADLERSGGAERDITGDIVRDLTSSFDAYRFSKIRIRRYEQVVSSREQADEAAEINNAALIIWGRYNDDGARLRLQVGASSIWDNDYIPVDDLSEQVEVDIILDDALTQTLTPNVVAVMNILNPVIDDSWNVAVNLVSLQLVDASPVEIVGGSAAARWHRYMGLYFTDPETALAEVDAAIELNPAPVYYMARSLNHYQLGNVDQALQDARTGQRLGGTDWPTATSFIGQYLAYEGEFQQSLQLLREALILRPNDWFYNQMLAYVLLYMGRYDEALEPALSSIENGALLNIPYLVAATVAFRQDDIAGAVELINSIPEVLRNPNSVEQILEVPFGLTADTHIAAASAEAFGNWLLGQDLQVINRVNNAESLDNFLVDLYLLQGLSHCNRGNHTAAVASYTKLLDAEPDYTLAYALRAISRRELGQTALTLRDVNTIRQSDNLANYTPYLAGVISGDVTCSNLLESRSEP